MSLLRISILSALLVVALFMGLLQGMDASTDRDHGAYRYGAPGTINPELAEDAARTLAGRLTPEATGGQGLDSTGQPLGDALGDESAALDEL